MIQLIYISTASRRLVRSDIEDILSVSRTNNQRDAITGMLYSDGKRFMQVLEGAQDRVDAALRRIRHDDRHFALVELSRHEIPARDFENWDMAYRLRGDDNEKFLADVAALVANASPAVRATFEGLAAYRAPPAL